MKNKIQKVAVVVDNQLIRENHLLHNYYFSLQMYGYNRVSKHLKIFLMS